MVLKKILVFVENLFILFASKAICEIGYVHAYNHFCLILAYSTSEECQSGGNGRNVAEANEDIKKELTQIKP